MIVLSSTVAWGEMSLEWQQRGKGKNGGRRSGRGPFGTHERTYYVSWHMRRLGQGLGSKYVYDLSNMRLFPIRPREEKRSSKLNSSSSCGVNTVPAATAAAASAHTIANASGGGGSTTLECGAGSGFWSSIALRFRLGLPCGAPR
jgi:hypothetical protein